MLWKLIIVNALMIAITIWLAGVSVKEFACLLVDQYPYIGREESVHFSETLQYFLFQSSFLAFLVAGILHYFFMRNLLRPLKRLGSSARQLAEGEYPPALPVVSRDEFGQLTADFNHLSQKLEQMEEMRKRMVGDIAHELRTPLTNVNGYLEALRAGIVTGSPELYQSLHEESLRITRLVEQLHQLNVWEAKKLSRTNLQQIEMETVMEECKESFRLVLQNKGMRDIWSVQAAQVWGERDGLKQVMDNLLSNAIRYDTGGWVRIEGSAVGDYYQVTVTNQGQPISADRAKHVFDRFYRVDSSRSKDTGGTGLGLALVKEIVEQHGGAAGLNVDGDEYSFSFTIPIDKHIPGKKEGGGNRTSISNS